MTNPQVKSYDVLQTVNKTSGKTRYYVDGARVTKAFQDDLTDNMKLDSFLTTIRGGTIRHYVSARELKA